MLPKQRKPPGLEAAALSLEVWFLLLALVTREAGTDFGQVHQEEGLSSPLYTSVVQARL